MAYDPSLNELMKNYGNIGTDASAAPVDPMILQALAAGGIPAGGAGQPQAPMDNPMATIARAMGTNKPEPTLMDAVVAAGQGSQDPAITGKMPGGFNFGMFQQSPEERKLARQALDDQRAGVASLQKRIREAQKTEPGVDPIVAALMGASDIVGGTKYTQNYLMPQKAEEKKGELEKIALEEQLQKARAGLTSEELKNLRENRTDRASLAALQASAGKRSASDELLIDKLGKNFTADLDAFKARAGNFGKAGASRMAAERALGLFNQYPDFNIPKSATTELATAVAGLVSNGSPQSQHQIDAITPQSARGGVQNMINFLTNNPGGLEQQKFMQQLHDTVLREKGIAEDQMRKVVEQRIPSHGLLKKKAPDEYQAILDSAMQNITGSGAGASQPQTTTDPKTGKKYRAENGFWVEVP